MKKTLIINYQGMQVGGIEVTFAKLFKYALQKEYRMIWLTTPNCESQSDFKDVTDNPKVEKVYVKKGFHWFPHEKIKFSKEEEVVMISCEPLDFARGESISEYARSVKSFNHYLLLPHFTGSAYYPERFFNSKGSQKRWWKVMREFALSLEENDCIRGFSLKHLDSYEANYELVIKNKDDKRIARVDTAYSIDIADLQKRAQARKSTFKIVACSRFDFPHKGFLLGLIDEYAELKKEYSHLELIIVGYGEGESRLKEKISKLPEEISKGITMTGVLSPEKLIECYKTGHLNVGLGGAMTTGALCGLPSLLVRHYTEDCETYGFANEIEGSFLKTEPGFDIKDHIKKVLSASDDEYVKMCLSDYKKIEAMNKNEPDYFFNQTRQNKWPVLSKKMISKLKWLNLISYFKKRFLKQRAYEEKEI